MMNIMKPRKLAIAAAVVPALGLGIAGNAQAGSYAYSFNELFNLTTVFDCSTSGVGCGVGGPDADFTLLSYQSSSVADANWSGIPGGVSDGQVFAGTGSPHPDAPIQYQGDGVAPANNDFSAIGKTGNYARGDAQIISEQIKGDDSTRALNVAEGNLENNGSYIANGGNSSTTGFEMAFSVDDTFFVDFSFQANPFMESLISWAGSTSTPDLDVSFTIQDLDAAGTPAVFSWAPNGVAGDAIGGNDTLDDANMNIEISDIIVDASSVIYDPVSGVCGGGACDYFATTDFFGAGNYNLILTMHEGVRGTVNHIPEPTTLALMGLGLAGFGYARRGIRNKAKA